VARNPDLHRRDAPRVAPKRFQRFEDAGVVIESAAVSLDESSDERLQNGIDGWRICAPVVAKVCTQNDIRLSILWMISDIPFLISVAAVETGSSPVLEKSAPILRVDTVFSIPED
jgi:hypothetical protein